MLRKCLLNFSARFKQRLVLILIQSKSYTRFISRGLSGCLCSIPMHCANLKHLPCHRRLRFLSPKWVLTFSSKSCRDVSAELVREPTCKAPLSCTHYYKERSIQREPPVCPGSRDDPHMFPQVTYDSVHHAPWREPTWGLRVLRPKLLSFFHHLLWLKPGFASCLLHVSVCGSVSGIFFHVILGITEWS